MEQSSTGCRGINSHAWALPGGYNFKPGCKRPHQSIQPPPAGTAISLVEEVSAVRFLFIVFRSLISMPHTKPRAKFAPKTLSDLVLEKAGVLSPDDTVQTAGDRMRASHRASLPVAESRRLVGVVDQPDPDRQAARYGHDPATTTVRETMNREVVFCFEEKDSVHALQLMIHNNLQTLTVLDREMRIVGVVSRADLAEVDQSLWDEASNL